MSQNPVKISAYCEITSSKRIYAKEYTSSGVPFYRGKEVVANFSGGSISDPLFISENKYEEIKHKFGAPEQGDLLLTSVGTIGVPYRVTGDLDFYFKDGNLTWFRNLKGLDQDFLYYWLQSSQGKAQLSKCTIGAAQPAYTIERLKEMDIELPPEDVQKEIASVIATYDSLIKNNRRRIQLLEESARLLYREWFIYLRFPGHEQVKITDGVPEGWNKKSLINIAELTMGQSPKSDFYNETGDGLPFHQGVTNYGARFVTHKIYSTKVTRIAEAGDILCSVRAPVGRLNITNDRIILGRGLAALRSKSGYQSFLFYALKSFFFKEDIIGGGAIYAAVTKKDMESIEILAPNESLLSEFESTAKNIDNQIAVLTQQNQKLEQARDLLLPKLMNGELVV